MSTGSIKHNIEITDSADAERFVEALEKAKAESEDMERLTEIKTHVTGFSYTDKKEGIFAQNVYAKLAAYEDTGLTPAQVEAMKMDMEQLRADNINAEMNLAHMAADKDEQAGRIMQQEMRIEYLIEHCEELEYLLRRTFYADALIDVLRDIFTDEEIQAPAQAKADGRLVVLPCKEVYTKAGDTLYLIDGGEIIEVTHCGAEISPSGEIYVVVAAEDKIFSFRQPDPENDLDPTDWCTETKEVMLDDFGKTVFLTREAAEKALGGGENGK